MQETIEVQEEEANDLQSELRFAQDALKYFSPIFLSKSTSVERERKQASRSRGGHLHFAKERAVASADLARG